MTLELALDLDDWRVTLVDGNTIRLRAASYSQEGEEYVFHALMRGTPHFDIPLAYIPVAIVADIEGG